MSRASVHLQANTAKGKAEDEAEAKATAKGLVEARERAKVRASTGHRVPAALPEANRSPY